MDTSTVQDQKPTEDVTVDAPATMTLTALDRCDSCGAQAYRVTRHKASDLMWCAHHYRRYEADLAPNLVHFQDVQGSKKQTAVEDEEV